MVQTVIRDRLDAILHWNISLVGGFLGAYAILLHVGNFGSAQTGNLMEMGAELVSMEWFNVLLRLAALVLFGLGVASAYLLTNFTKINMRMRLRWHWRRCCRLNRRWLEFIRFSLHPHFSGASIPVPTDLTARRSL